MFKTIMKQENDFFSIKLSTFEGTLHKNLCYVHLITNTAIIHHWYSILPVFIIYLDSDSITVNSVLLITSWTGYTMKISFVHAITITLYQTHYLSDEANTKNNPLC